MKGKRIVTIQDLSCVGQCSLTVALPVLSALGVEAAVLPTSILSNHTMFPKFTKLDLDDEVDKIFATWEEIGFTFDCLYTGYIGNSYLVNKINSVKKTITKGVVVIDPAMADNGKLYYGFDDGYVDAMKKLCNNASVILPNITEACLLLGEEYGEKNLAQCEVLAKKLSDTFNASVVLKGVSDGGNTGVLIYDKDAKTSLNYIHKKLPVNFHGTGDIFASVFVGMMENGYSAYESASQAADFVVTCIADTMDDKDHLYGVHFERNLKDLGKFIK